MYLVYEYEIPSRCGRHVKAARLVVPEKSIVLRLVLSEAATFV